MSQENEDALARLVERQGKLITELGSENDRLRIEHHAMCEKLEELREELETYKTPGAI